MPASRRHRRTLAVFVHCLGILAAVPALPTAAPRAAAAPAHAAPAPSPPVATGIPAAPPAVAPTSAAPYRPPPAPVTVAMAPSSTPAPGYRIHVRNTGSTMVETTVRQEVLLGSKATTVTA